MSEPHEGLRVPIHHALTTPLLLAGIPRSACYLLWTLAAAFAFGMQEIWVVPIASALHLALMALTRYEPHFMVVFRQAIKVPPRLHG
jgi:type IV secretory pathway TrbD component